MTIRNKILGGFSVITVLALIIGIVGFVSTRMINVHAEELNEYSKHLYSVSSILNTHYSWRNNLTESIVFGNEFTGSLDPTSCALGRWLVTEAEEVTDPRILNYISQIRAPHDAIHNNAKSVAEKIKDGDLDAAMDDFSANVLPNFEGVITALNGMAERYNELVNGVEDEIEQISLTAEILIVIVSLAVIIICITLALKITSGIQKDLSFLSGIMADLTKTGDFNIDSSTEQKINLYCKRKGTVGQISNSFRDLIDMMKLKLAALNEVANGNLAVEVIHRSPQDSYGNALQKMVDNLNGMFSEIRSSTNQVSHASMQIADGAQSLASGSTEQAATLQELSASISDISDKTRENAKRTESASRLAQDIMGSAEKGSRQMEQMISAVNEIEASNQNISKVIKAIDDIAFQTNILALNAAVEAARAGAAGKGFAVVAEEVRNLAAKSAESAKDTGSIIENSMEKARLGSQIAGETAASLNEIVSGIDESAKIISDIALSSEEQNNAIGQVNLAIGGVTQVVQQNSATAEESAAASEEMSGQASVLESLVSKFKLRN
ncbi:MAG: methyl-accepting chemotaxis protein [Oscillospiraceae bacterium]|nr:methyl-accepting chemotaxis protein [Oscillospiraceae bacterium]